MEEVVDRAGQLLTIMIESMELIKSDVYISNIIMKTSKSFGYSSSYAGRNLVVFALFNWSGGEVIVSLGATAVYGLLGYEL